MVCGLVIVEKLDATTALKCAKKVWVERWGLPLVILSDAIQGFHSDIWKNYWQRKSARVIIVLLYMQRANQSSERLTQTLMQVLR